MGQISFDNPIPGQSDSTEEPKIVTALTTIRDAINGRLDTNNLSASAGILDTQLGGNPLSSAWRPLARVSFADSGGLPAATNYVATITNDIAIATGNHADSTSPFVTTMTGILSVVPSGRTLQARLRAVFGANSFGHAALDILVVPVGITGVVSLGYQLSYGVSVTTVRITPVANGFVEVIGTPFTPSNNFYCFLLNAPTASSSSSAMFGFIELEYRYV